ncbi:MAG: BrnT family toxin [Rhizomicrobium sp.]
MDNVERFEWDVANTFKSFVKHGVSQGEIEQVFVNSPLLLLEDARHSELERRLHAYGKSAAGRLLQVAFTLRDSGKVIRVISARPMSRKERLRYAQET